MAKDSFQFPPGNNSSSSPARRFVSIPSGADYEFTEVPKGIYVGNGGDLVLVGMDAPDGAPGVLFANLGTGTHPFRPRKVIASGTTATDLVALY